MAKERSGDGAVDLGQRFEAENEAADLGHWRTASDAERSRVIAELMVHAESVAAATGIRNDEPAPALPAPRRRSRGDAR